MNILLVTGVFTHNKREPLGGMGKAVYMIANGLQERGNEVKILAPGNGDQRRRYRGVEVLSYKSDQFLEIVSDFKMLLAIIQREINIQKKIKDIGRTWKIDVIHYTGWFGIGLLHIGKIPAVMRISSYTKAQLSSNYTQFRIRVLSFLEQTAARKMNFIFAPSNVMAQALGKDIKRDIKVIETPYIPEKVYENTEILDKKLKGKKYLLFVGRMSVDKGIFVVRDVLQSVLQKYSDIYFVFAGVEAEKGITKEIVMAAGEYKHRVVLLGNLSHELLFPIMREAEIILIPSLMDNFPNTCAEAMSLGCIVIGTEGSSLEQFITDGYDGFLAQRNSADSLGEQIKRALSMDAERKAEMKIHAMMRVQQLDQKKFFDKLERIYYRVLNMSYKNYIMKNFSK